MVGDTSALVLDVGTGRGGLAGMLQQAGHRVCCLDRSEAAVRRLAQRDAGPAVVGQVESMPFLACHFDVVTAAQTLHRFAPGLALSEIARVLRPGGHLAALYVTRDDTVPWVQRLAAPAAEVRPGRHVRRLRLGLDRLDHRQPLLRAADPEELPQLGAGRS